MVSLDECKGCRHLIYDKSILNFNCGEFMGVRYNRNNCPYYSGSLDELDFYQLVDSVAEMLLWNWSINLKKSSDDSYTLTVFNEDWFKSRLIKELLNKEGL